MEVFSSITIIFIIILLGVMVGGIFLQLFLSKKENKWFGLILPAITFLLSLVSVFNVKVSEELSGVQVFMQFAGTFLLGNISTVVLLGIYFGCREKMKISRQLEKMNIQDLD